MTIQSILDEFKQRFLDVWETVYEADNNVVENEGAEQLDWLESKLEALVDSVPDITRVGTICKCGEMIHEREMKVTDIIQWKQEKKSKQ